jgi:hypothetical protein
MNTTVPTPPTGRRTVLDSAHVGDIHGALGTIRSHHAPPRGRRRRLLALLAIMGPGLIVMVGDNDAGGVATYAQAGQNYGLTLLWTLLLLIPVLVVNQEMVVRLGAVTGVGHARLIIERFGKFCGAFSVGDLFILNFLTIVTEFIGVSLALGYVGISKYVSVPLAAAALIAMTATGSFRRWERFMYLFIATNFVAIPLVIASHPHAGPIISHTLIPGVQGGLGSTSMLLIIAIVGTTVAPWQLFFQQSNVIDKRITPRWINYERADTIIGSVVQRQGRARAVDEPRLAERAGRTDRRRARGAVCDPHRDHPVPTDGREAARRDAVRRARDRPYRRRHLHPQGTAAHQYGPDREHPSRGLDDAPARAARAARVVTHPHRRHVRATRLPAARRSDADRQGDRGQCRPMNALSWSDFVMRFGAAVLAGALEARAGRSRWHTPATHSPATLASR